MRLKIKNYSLIEILCVITIGIIIMTLSMKFFNTGNRLCLDYARKAEASLAVNTLKKCWRTFVLERGNPVSVQNDKIVFESGNYAQIEKDRLLMFTENGRKYFTLPFGSSASFGEEKVSGGLNLFTFTLYPYSLKTVRPEHGKIRIVAGIRQSRKDDKK